MAYVVVVVVFVSQSKNSVIVRAMHRAHGFVGSLSSQRFFFFQLLFTGFKNKTDIPGICTRYIYVYISLQMVSGCRGGRGGCTQYQCTALPDGGGGKGNTIL